MNNVKKIGILLLALGVMTGFSQAASQKEKPDGTLKLSGKSLGIGIGFSWGKGTLTYKGKDYAVSVDGLSLGKVGISGATAAGEVYNLKKLEDFSGNYNAAAGGATLAGGHTTVALKNQNGVRVLLAATTRGVDLTAAGGSVKMKLK